VSSAQDKWVLAAIAVSESAWLYAILGVAALPLQLGSNPLDWFAVLAVLASSLVVSRALQALIISTTTAYLAQMFTGLVVIYLVLGSQFSAGLDLAWAGRLSGELGSDTYWLRAAIAAAMAVGLWWRGGRIAASDSPEETLETSFRIGVAALAAAAIADAALPADLNVYPVLFIFTAASLAGLAVSHLSSPSEQAAKRATWPKVIGALVLVVLLVGLIAGLVENTVLPLVTGAVRAVVGFTIERIVAPVLSTLLYPFVAAMDWLFSALLNLFRTDLEQQVAEGFNLAIPEVEQIEEKEGAPAVLQIIQIAGIAVLTVVVVVALFFLARAFRRRRRGRYEYPEGARESVIAGNDPLLDAARLLFDLLPERLRRRRVRRDLRPPDGEPGVVEAFEIYYSLLGVAERRGVLREEYESPLEFEVRLGPLFAPGLVEKATAAFNRACYGNLPPSETDLADLRSAIAGGAAS
jgi:hypothetical protein